MQSMLNYESNDESRCFEEAKANLEEVIEDIAKLCCEKNKNIVEEYLNGHSDAIEGFSQPKTWKLKKMIALINTIDCLQMHGLTMLILL